MLSAGKWIACWMTQKIYGMSHTERKLMFGLSTAQAAATLAAVLVGYNIILPDGERLLNEDVLNGTILLILVTCIVSSVTTQQAAKKAAVEEPADMSGHDGQTEKILIPVANSNAVTNYSKQETRRAEWVFGVEYGEDFEKVKAVLQRIIDADPRILKDPAPMIALGALSASSVDIKVRAWAKTADYWDVYFDMNKIVYDTFNKEGIGFPFPQLTVHQAKD